MADEIEVVEQPQVVEAATDPTDFDSFLPEPGVKPPAQPQDGAPAAVSPALKVAQPKAAEKPKETPKPAISNELLDLAESLGVDRREAASFNDPASLQRALSIYARRPHQAKEAEKPVEQSKDEIVAHLDALDKSLIDDGYEGPMNKIVASLKTVWSKMNERFGELNDKTIAPLLNDQKARFKEKTDQDIDHAVTEAGHDAKTVTQDQRNKILTVARNMIQGLQGAGLEWDAKEVLKQVTPMVLGQRQQEQVTETVARAPNPARQAQVAAQERNGHGRFVPGMPTHRKVADGVKGGNLRAALLDSGYDPGPQVDDDFKGLPG